MGAHAHSQTARNERRPVPLPTLRFPAGKDVVEVPFEVESGWVVIPVKVNGSRALRFVLDSGAGAAAGTNPAIVESLNLNIVGKMLVRGVGGGGASSAVSVAGDVTFNIGGIELANGNLAIHSSRSGLDGIIGRSIFANLVVEIDWEKQVVKFYEPLRYKYSGSGSILPLTFDEGGRPYTMASVMAAEKTIPVKLVVDTGGSHALSLDVGSNSEIKLPEGATKTVLGRGGSGEIAGYTGRVKSLELGGQKFKDVPTIFPDSSSGTAGVNGRHGNLGSGILRRFKVIYDYSRKQMIVEPNKFSNDPFGTVMPRTAAGSIGIARTTLPDYVGKYGNKEISIKDGSLYYQRIGGSGAALRATAKDKFALNNDAQITFVRDANGVVAEMIVEWVERDKEQLKREAPSAAVNQPNSQSQNQPQTQQRLSQAEQEVRKLEREWLDAYEQHDTAAIDRIVADDFRLTQSGGVEQTKSDILAALKATRDPARPEPKFSTEDVESRVEDDRVILTGRFIQRMERDGQTMIMAARYTDTYLMRQGRWQVVASQMTPIPRQVQPKMTEAEIVKETEAYLAQAVAEDTFSGAALVAKDSKPIFEKAYGLANKSSNTPNNVDTKFNLGSINKSFTSIAVAQLAQQGKLSFKDPISKYLPDYPNKMVAGKVTIHQLLTHTSGMGMYFNEEFMNRRASLKTLADILPLFVNDALAFEPGEKMQYSNAGYVVLGLIIERLTKQNYFDYVRVHIFKPAGMTNTDSYELEQKVPNLAIGYTNMGPTGRPEPGPRQENTSHLTGRGSSAGGGYSTLGDMLKFGRALVGHKLLNQQYTDIVLSNQMPPGQPPAGYGFFSIEVNGTRAIGNNGGGPGTNSTFTVYPELGYTVVIMSNYDPPSATKVTSKLREMLTAK
jgi:CubicO group peptidase (beta-lactamase class C family)